MKKLAITVLLGLYLCSLIVVGFPQGVLAARAELTIKDIQCPRVGWDDLVRYVLSSRAQEQVSSLPEGIETTKFWPENLFDGDCSYTQSVIDFSSQFQLPVDVDIWRSNQQSVLARFLEVARSLVLA